MSGKEEKKASNDKFLQKSLGVTELAWECPYCDSMNRGASTQCVVCGGSQPDDVVFVKTEAREIVDEGQAEAIRAQGANVHCPFCGTRNTSINHNCINCNGDLTGAEARGAGKRVVTQEEWEETRYDDGTKPQGRSVSGRGCLIAVGVVFGLFALFIFFSTRTSETVGTVQAVEWERSVQILAYQAVEKEAWADEVPRDASLFSCREEERYRSQNAELNSVEVCGEPYEVDLGNGFAEVVQDCEYIVYDDFCRYEGFDWVLQDTLETSGEDFEVYWPEFSLLEDQDIGEEDEAYTITFSDDGERYIFRTDDPDVFADAEFYDEWVLDVNTFGQVNSAEPRR